MNWQVLTQLAGVRLLGYVQVYKAKEFNQGYCLEQTQREVRAGGGLRITIFQVLQPNHPLPDGLLLSRVRVRARVYMILHVIAGIPCQISDQFVFFFSVEKGCFNYLCQAPKFTLPHAFISCHVTQRLVKFNSHFFLSLFIALNFAYLLSETQFAHKLVSVTFDVQGFQNFF